MNVMPDFYASKPPQMSRELWEDALATLADILIYIGAANSARFGRAEALRKADRP